MPDEHVDVLIIGAGISGIGAACRLRQRCPEKSVAILEGRDAIGGTWDLFRFPGIRSDSDMFTLSYPFRPWSGSRAIVDGASIREYVRETAREYGVDELIRFRHRVVGAEWSSGDARWTVLVERSDTGETLRMSCGVLFSCTGYYRYDQGYTPSFEGVEDYRGEIVHPQFWGEDIEHSGKRVIVIGSGATAVTLVPSLAQRAAHVTMLQRSPTYIVSLPEFDPIAGILGRVLPARWAYSLVRWKNVGLMVGLYSLSKRRPTVMKRLIRALQKRQLPPGYDLDTHFNPRYQPWDQRLCLVPDNDLFKAISAGSVDVVTDRIERFTESGLKLESGAELEADMIVTATGLEMLPLGGIELRVDGTAVQLPETLAYRGMMLSGVPNLAYSFGYINESWTLGSDLTCEQVCRLLKYMDAHGYVQCTPRAPADAPREVQFADFTANYVKRAIQAFPKESSDDPWIRKQNYFHDLRVSRRVRVDDPALEYSRGSRKPGEAPALVG
jgi:monooxygenase